MTVRVQEIAPGIHRLSTYVAEIAPPVGFTFNQYLVEADEPLLFHCGMRGMFGEVSRAVAGIVPLARLKWIGFGHVEADECGAMNDWLQAAPDATVVHGGTACMVSLNDLALRAPRALANGEVLDLGGKRVRYIDTPHVPHAWESGVMFEETTATLLCGDLFTHLGDGPAMTTKDILAPAIAAEEAFQSSAVTPLAAPTIRALAALRPARLAVMHGSCFEGDCVAALNGLADYFEARLRTALPK